jgi:hypothetical protein
MMEALSSSETSVLTIGTPRNIPEDGLLHSHIRENLQSYRTLMCPSLLCEMSHLACTLEFFVIIRVDMHGQRVLTLLV